MPLTTICVVPFLPIYSIDLVQSINIFHIILSCSSYQGHLVHCIARGQGSEK